MDSYKIYAIEHKATHSAYIGMTVNLKTRWQDHRRLLRNNQHTNTELQADWNRYGEQSFDFRILEDTQSCDNHIAGNREGYWTDIYNQVSNCYGSSNATAHDDQSKPSPNRMVKVAITIRQDQLNYLDRIEIESRSSIIRQLLDQWMSQDKK